MKLLITGVPGSGKTLISTSLQESISNSILINDTKFSKKHNCGTYNSQQEYIVDIDKLNIAVNKFLDNNINKNLIFEGHLWVELDSSILNQFDICVLLNIDASLLRKRLIERNYNALKIEDNVYCLENNYLNNVLDSKNIIYKVIKVDSNLNNNLKLIKMIINK